VKALQKSEIYEIPCTLPKKRFCAYMRVSSDSQKKDGTIENQRIIIRSWLQSNPNVEIIDWFEDDGVSAFKDRPNYKKMMEGLTMGLYSGVIITKLSRIGRSVKQLQFIADFMEEKHLDFIVIGDSIDTGTPQGRLFFHLLASFMEYEADLIKERTSEGRARAKANGKQFGRPPKKVADKKIRELYESGLGCNRISKMVELSATQVFRRLKRMKVQMRERTEYIKNLN
jgi:DNA invertase Pin-like site-specific DNA recombinase